MGCKKQNITVVSVVKKCKETKIASKRKWKKKQVKEKEEMTSEGEGRNDKWKNLRSL